MIHVTSASGGLEGWRAEYCEYRLGRLGLDLLNIVIVALIPVIPSAQLQLCARPTTPDDLELHTQIKTFP